MNATKRPSVVDPLGETWTAGGIASKPAEAKSAGNMDTIDNGRGTGVVYAKTWTPATGAHDSQGHFNKAFAKHIFLGSDYQLFSNIIEDYMSIVN